MFTLTLKAILANPKRFLLTGVAVVLGVAFMSGTFVLTDTIKRSYDDLAVDVYDGTDAVVRSASSTEGAGPHGATARGTVDGATLDAVRAVPGVATAEPQVVGAAVVVGRDGDLLDDNPHRAVPIAVAWQSSPELNPLELVAGEAPGADGVVVDRSSADAGGFAVGDTVRVVGPTGPRELRVSGIATYAGSDDAAGAQVVAMAPATAAEVLGTGGRFTAVQVVAEDGVSQDQLRDRLATALDGGAVEVLTGSEMTDEAADTTGSLPFVGVFLLSFALTALVVGAFVIYNTFSITVAQRTRETALLRAIGARRRQVLRAVRFEAFLTGVAASAVGVAAGVGMAKGLRAVLEAFGMELPSGATVVAPRSIVVSMAVGVVVTVVAAWVPARRAAKVAPIEALRESALGGAATSVRRVVAGVAVVAAGALLLAQGLSGAGVGAVGMGALATFLGVAMLGPVIAGRFAAVVGSPLPRLRGTAGSLAQQNAMRNPRRTAATASALMIGIGLVAFITVFAASAKASMAESVDSAMRSDFIVTTQFGMGGLDTDVARRIDELPETGAVTALRYFDTEVAGVATSASAVDPQRVEASVELDVRDGRIADLGAHGVAVRHDVAVERGIGVGDTVELAFAETGVQAFDVVAVYGTKEPMGDYVISHQAFDANMAVDVDNDIVVSRADGVSAGDTRRAVDAVLADYPTAELMTEEEFTDSMAGAIEQVLNLVYVLLAMALLIALFGIANTLALSVLERTREIGVLRAIGMSRSEVRSTVRWESVLIALLGTSLGSVIGLGFAWALTTALEDQGFNTFAVPTGQLAAIVTLAALAAVVAAARPARQAANLDILAAVQHS
jgi:putative ABC transport system permease protein